jgi:hypothetical protein
MNDYVLKNGEKAIIKHRIGRAIDRNGFMLRSLASVAIQREDGSLVYKGHTPYWIKNTSTYASHYKSGRNKKDEESYQMECKQLQEIVNEINQNLQKETI